MFVLPVDPTRFATFLGVMGVLAITPGPANVFAIATGAEKGRAAALVGVAGMNAATLVWFSAAALGLGALILTFPKVFHVIAYAGAAYVAWLGAKSIWAALHPVADVGHSRVRLGTSALRDGFAVQISNPKAVLFFTAVLPPFLDPSRPLPAQLAMFALATITFDVIAMSAYGLGGAALAARMHAPQFHQRFQFGVGALLLAAAFLMVIRH